MPYADQRFANQLERQLNRHGPRSVFRTRRSLKSLIAEHEEKLERARYRERLIRELATFYRQLETVEPFTRDRDLHEDE